MLWTQWDNQNINNIQTPYEWKGRTSGTCDVNHPPSRNMAGPMKNRAFLNVKSRPPMKNHASLDEKSYEEPRSTIFCIRRGSQHEASTTEADEHCWDSQELQMHLEERCMLEGNANGLDVDHLACVWALHSNGKLCMQMCRTSIIWLMYQSSWSTERSVWDEYMCV